MTPDLERAVDLLRSLGAPIEVTDVVEGSIQRLAEWARGALTKDLDPRPGEVWICTEKTGPDGYHIGGTSEPFVVTYLSRSTVGYTTAGQGPEPHTACFHRNFVWHEHMARIWPPPPPWDDLDGAPPAGRALLADDDLRAQRGVGRAD